MVVYECRDELVVLVTYPIFQARNAMPAGTARRLKLHNFSCDGERVVRPDWPQEAQFVDARTADDAIFAEKPTFNRQCMDSREGLQPTHY